MEEMRPNSEQLLRRLKYEEEQKQTTRGKLKIFLGYAAGSGKTYTMLEAAHEAKKHGIDFLAASDVAEPSSRDREHMDEESHRRFAEAVYERLAG